MGSSAGERIRLRLFLIVRIVACCDGTGDALRSISCPGLTVSVFSMGKVIRDPPRTPPSHDKKQASTAPMSKMMPAKKVGRR